MNISVNTPIKTLCEKLLEAYGGNVLNYGEAVESLVDNQAANFVTTDGNQFCTVNDAYKVVLFYVKQNASPSEQRGGGNNRVFYRTINYKMAANALSQEQEYVIANIINSIVGMSYDGSGYSSRSIASEYFGLEERNFQTSFFTIDFSVIEKITCEKC